MGVTPLALASRLGDLKKMTYLIGAGATKDDGSLQDAALYLELDAMRLLLQEGHMADYQSRLHNDRTALAQLCLGAVGRGRNSKLEEAIKILISNTKDTKLRYDDGKTFLHYALDSSDPFTVLKALLPSVWKSLNDEAFLYCDGKFTYSLTKYVEMDIWMGCRPQKQEVLSLLRDKGAIDQFWANSNSFSPRVPSAASGLNLIMDEAYREANEKVHREVTEILNAKLGRQNQKLKGALEVMDIDCGNTGLSPPDRVKE